MRHSNALAVQNDDSELKAIFTSLATRLNEQESTIVAELNGSQGKAIDTDGYYQPDEAKAQATQ